MRMNFFEAADVGGDEAVSALAQLELDTLEQTRSWLADNPTYSVEDLWEYLESSPP